VLDDELEGIIVMAQVADDEGWVACEFEKPALENTAVREL